MKLPSPLHDWFDQRQSSQCHRQLLVISGDQNWAKTTANTLIKLQGEQSILWVGDIQADFENIHIKDFRAKLGQEYDWVVLDGFSGFRASAAMALSGTIKAQGTMLLICPELSTWPLYQDPEQLNRTSFGATSELLPSRFIQYLTSCFKEHQAVAILTADKFSANLGKSPQPVEQDLFTEQKLAIAAICKVAQGRNKRPLVLTADRGRGKSSALGIAAANLMQTPATTIWVTAPHIQNVDQVFSHCLALLPEAKFDKNNLSLHSSHLTFRPIDLLLHSQDLPDILLVDEASAIPIHILLKLTQKFSRIVFSSTVHGYEGSGRGFEIKFRPLLAKIRPDYKSLHLSQPIRWFNDDDLEQFWFKTFFYPSKDVALDNTNLAAPIEYKFISQAELLANKQILAKVFTLLLDAHYQTSPDDLQRLLDSPEIKCFVIMQGETVIAVAQIIEEGGECLDEITNQIADNSRRVKGHLVAQNIASSYHQPDFCQAKQWRVSRIAVEPSKQRMGWASKLLTYIESVAPKDNIAFLTVAFGASQSLLGLWHHLGYSAVKLSLKPEVSSGEHSCILIKPLSNHLAIMTQEITAEFFKDLTFYMDKDFNSLPAEVLIEILINSNHHTDKLNMPIIKQFINNKRNLSNCRRVLVFALLARVDKLKQLAVDDQNFLVNLLLQHKNYQEITGLYKLTGKKQIEQKLRVLFALLF